MPNINDVSLATLSLAGLTGAKFTTTAYANNSTAAAGDLTGAAVVFCVNTGATPGTLTTRTAAQMIADASLQVGQIYVLFLINNQGTGAVTLTGGTGVTVSGTATAGTNACTMFQVQVNTPTTMTFTRIVTFTTAA